MDQAVTVLVGLAAALIGASVSYGFQRRLWRRDARLHSYAKFAQVSLKVFRAHRDLLHAVEPGSRILDASPWRFLPDRLKPGSELPPVLRTGACGDHAAVVLS